jgi:signal transduction histidine kinase
MAPQRAVDTRSNAVTNGIKIEDNTKLDRLVHDAGEELSVLRRDVARYRNIFDSARLIVGHEFARPLTAISGYLDLLENKLGPALHDQETGYFAKMREAIGHLEDLVESFVQMLRFEAESDEVQVLERVEIASLIGKVAGRSGEHADSVVVETEGEIPPFRARRRCLEVVLENLVSNALKHGGARDRIVVRASLKKERRSSSNEDRLVVSVEDHGDGIPADKIEDIFKPFFRLGNRGDSNGLGLGLALVKSVITIMGGEISVRSKPGEGTTVTIVVPVHGTNNGTTDTIG